MLPSRVPGVILVALEDLESELERENDERLREEAPDAYQNGETGAAFMDEKRAIVLQLIRAKTTWLEARGTHDPLYGAHVPDWFLDYQREIAEILLTRQWIEKLEFMAERLMRIPSLVISRNGAKECHVCLAEAAHCYLTGLFGAAAALCRSALETGLRDRLSDQGGVVIPFDRDFIKRAIETAKGHRLLTWRATKAADQVRTIGNSAAHGRQIDQALAEKTLIATRLVIEELYGGVPNPGNL